MKTILINTLPNLVTVVLFVLLCIWLWKRGKRDIVKKIIYGMVCRAEQLYGSKTGDEKLAEVWAQIYERLPLIIRLAFPRKDLEKFIEEGVQILKKKLQSGEMNLLTYNQEAEKAAVKIE